MAKAIEIKREAFFSSDSGKRFVILGHAQEPESTGIDSVFKRIKRKILRQNTNRVKEVWGTLGLANSTEPQWSGSIVFSQDGNERSIPETSSSATVYEVDALRKSPDVRSSPIVERFIDFQNVHFPELPTGPLDEDSLPLLRLTLMLGSDEGALVYYQVHKLGTTGFNEQPDEIAVDVIAPESVEPDRVNYLFKLRPSRKIVEDDYGKLKLGQEETGERFIVKILTFRKSVNRLHNHFLGHNHDLLIWRPEYQAFSRLATKLKGDVPTLLLLHGTASSTHQAFKGLMTGDDQCWLARQHVQAGGRYQQILAFDHPTFSEDAEMNVRVLTDLLGRGFSFTHPVDLIAHSRGGLVSKYISLYKQDTIPIRKGILAACANGVGYFTAARNLSYLMSVLRYSGTGNSILLSALQYPLNAIREMPGSLLMTPGNDRLKEVLSNPSQDTTTQFMPVVGDYDYQINTSGRLLRRWKERGLDKLITLFLGERHDWVVGTDEQLIVSPHHELTNWEYVRSQPEFTIPTRHSGYFPSVVVQHRMNRFLES